MKIEDIRKRLAEFAEARNWDLNDREW